MHYLVKLGKPCGRRRQGFFFLKELLDDQFLERVSRWRSGLELGGTKLKQPAQKLRTGEVECGKMLRRGIT